MRCEDFPCCGHDDGGCGGSSYPRRGSYSGRGRAPQARRTPPKDGTSKANKYPGECAHCGGHLAAEAGVITARGGKWVVSHRRAETYGFPVPVWNYGCPGEALKLNMRDRDARAGWGGDTAALDSAIIRGEHAEVTA